MTSCIRRECLTDLGRDSRSWSSTWVFHFENFSEDEKPYSNTTTGHLALVVSCSIEHLGPSANPSTGLSGFPTCAVSLRAFDTDYMPLVCNNLNPPQNRLINSFSYESLPATMPTLLQSMASHPGRSQPLHSRLSARPCSFGTTCSARFSTFLRSRRIDARHYNFTPHDLQQT